MDQGQTRRHHEFRIWGRVARLGKSYRAMVSAVPREPGAGPQMGDIRARVFSHPAAAQEALGLLAHRLALHVMARGDRVIAIDVR